MKCPACKNTLVILEAHRIEIDYCSKCEGVWLDSGELELMIESEDEKAKLFQSLIVVEDSPEKKLRCPICKIKMEKVIHKDLDTVTDKCIRNHGIWFDKGELNSILKHSSLHGENIFTEILNELFRT